MEFWLPASARGWPQREGSAHDHKSTCITSSLICPARSSSGFSPPWPLLMPLWVSPAAPALACVAGDANVPSGMRCARAHGGDLPGGQSLFVIPHSAFKYRCLRATKAAAQHFNHLCEQPPTLALSGGRKLPLHMDGVSSRVLIQRVDFSIDVTTSAMIFC